MKRKGDSEGITYWIAPVASIVVNPVFIIVTVFKKHILAVKTMKRKKKKVVRTYRIARTAFGVPAPCSFAWWITLWLSSMLSSSSSSYSSFLILLVTSDFSSAFFLSALFPTYFWVDTGRIRGQLTGQSISVEEGQLMCHPP